MGIKRTFIALHIQPDSELANFIAHGKEHFKNDRIKWVDPGNLHLTLTFLGESDPSQVETVSSAIPRELLHIEKFRVRIEGFGCFPNAKRARVFWAGMLPIEPLKRLKAITDKIATGAGFEIDRRKYQPHLTLGRPKWIEQSAKVQDFVDRYSGVFFQESPIETVIYYESILKPDGPRYQVIESFPLR